VANGETKTAWVCDYFGQNGKRRRTPCASGARRSIGLAGTSMEPISNVIQPPAGVRIGHSCRSMMLSAKRDYKANASN
jgi:hypothetical protein